MKKDTAQEQIFNQGDSYGALSHVVCILFTILLLLFSRLLMRLAGVPFF